MLGLYIPSWRRPLAGLLSSALGLAAVVIVNALIVFAGSYVDAEETYVLTVRFAGQSHEILQEYAMYFSVPVSVGGFFLGLILDRGESR